MMRSYFERELGHCTQITPELHKQRARCCNRLRWAIGSSW